MAELDLFTEGMRAYRKGNYEKALRALSALTDRGDLPGRVARHYCAMSHRAMALARIAAGSFAQAAAHLRRAIALIGNRADLAEYLLVAYAGTGQYDHCAAAADALADARPDEVAPRVYLAQAQWRSGSRPLAYMTLTDALRRLGDHADLHRNLALFHAEEGHLEAARQHLLQAIECDCTSSRAHRYLGLVESARGDFHQAARTLQRAWVLDPKDLMAAYLACLAAEASAQAGRPVTIALPAPAQGTAPSQIRQLADYAAEEPAFIEAFLALPPSDADEELFGVLVSVLRMALACHGDYADLHYCAGVAFRRLGDAASAARHLRHAVRINPDYVKPLVQLGELAAAGAPEQAVAYFQRALQAGADWPDLHVRLGDALKECGRNSSARSHYRKALQLNERYEPAASGLASLAA